MKRKIERVYRDRHLTDEEAKHYAALRRTVEEEFGAPDVSTSAAGGVLTQELRRAIQESGRSIQEIGQASDVSPRLIERFVRGEMNIPLVTADRLARALGLHLSIVS